ncbi:uncharacterized protein LOC115209512 isoform X1 [Octopus sinensis]|uniref:Uncharacterized protein LOC115209512 isoform X1 n=1 Tax=Octopus sinensis TaxID=2607531 RepID=A0A7E6EQ80_9MOLL|nr:uncharacterized protein LOC115209512 isoform X1 [Octopus sinensis]
MTTCIYLQCVTVHFLLYIFSCISILCSIILIIWPMDYTRHHVSFRQIGTANLLTAISIFLQPVIAYFWHGTFTCCINSSLVTNFMMITFCLKCLVFIERYKHMRNTLGRSNSQWDNISCSCLKAMNVIAWIIPVVILIGWFSYLRKDYIYLLNSSCNWTIPKEYSVENDSTAFLFWFNNSFPVGIYIIVLIAIPILSFKLIKMYTQAIRNRGIIGYRQRRQEHQLQAHLAFDVIFMICWGPSIIINIIMLYNSCSHTPACISVIIFLLQAILAPSQGIIDFVAFYFNVNRWCLFLAEDDPNIMTPLLHSS